MNKFFNVIERTPPLLLMVLSWVITLLFSAIATQDWMNDKVGIPILFLTVILFILLFSSSIVYAINFKIDKYYLLRIVQLFIILALAFANIYYILIFTADPNKIYEGIHPLWEWLGGTQGRRLYWENIWQTAIDCIYFSFSTITTSAYGDIKPIVWYTKLLSNLEVLFGLGLISIGIGRYFNSYQINKKC
jgi:hypothetical protein